MNYISSRLIDNKFHIRQSIMAGIILFKLVRLASSYLTGFGVDLTSLQILYSRYLSKGDKHVPEGTHEHGDNHGHSMDISNTQFVIFIIVFQLCLSWYCNLRILIIPRTLRNSLKTNCLQLHISSCMKGLSGLYCHDS